MEVEVSVVKQSFQDLVAEIVKEDIEIIQEVFEEEILPLIQHQQKLEKEAFDAAYRDLLKLEAE